MRRQGERRQGVRIPNVRFGQQSRLKKYGSYAKKTLYGVGGVIAATKIASIFSDTVKNLFYTFSDRWGTPAIMTLFLSMLIIQILQRKKIYKNIFNKWGGAVYYLFLITNMIVIWNYSLVFSNMNDIISTEATIMITQGSRLYEDIFNKISRKTVDVAGHMTDYMTSPKGIIKLISGSPYLFQMFNEGLQYSITIGMTAGMAAVTKSYDSFLNILDGMITFTSESDQVHVKTIGYLLMLLRKGLDIKLYEKLKYMGQKVDKENVQNFIEEVQQLISPPKFKFAPKITSQQFNVLSDTERLSAPIADLISDQYKSVTETFREYLSYMMTSGEILLNYISNISKYVYDIIDHALKAPYIYTEKLDVEKTSNYIISPLKEGIDNLVSQISDENKRELTRALGDASLLETDKNGFLGELFDLININVKEGIRNINIRRNLYRSHMIPWESIGLLTASQYYIILLFIMVITTPLLENINQEESEGAFIEELPESPEQQEFPPSSQRRLSPRQQIPTTYSPPTSPRGARKKQSQKFIELPPIQEYAQPYPYEEVLYRKKEESEASKLDKMISLLGSLEESLSRQRKPKKKESPTYKEEIFFEELPKKSQQYVEAPTAGGIPEGAFESISKKRSSPQKRITQYFGKSKQQ